MKKIVILGCENSHADAFMECIQKKPEFAHIEVLGVYSEDAEAAKKLGSKYSVPLMASYDEAVGKVDGVVITAPDLEHEGRERTIIVYYVYYR